MRKSTLSFLIILLPVSFLYSQENKWGLSFTPALVTTESLHPALQLGVEYRIRERWHLLTEIAVPVKKDEEIYATNSAYFRIKPELRYKLTRGVSDVNFYTGLQLSYAYRKWKDPNEGCYFEDKLYEDSCITYSSASINTPIYTSSAQIGTVITLGQHFGLDLFLGMGVRVINTTYSEVQNRRKDFSLRPNCMILFFPDPADWVNGRITRFHFNGGIRFMYRF